ncbi:IPExxxVDY family protein [Litoribacter ruber]|uniref:IPExxxVDY family protein n=1 Tax=Litoribacter ruber TaxID=702568 RepID=UPI001BD9B9B3|nr:IPExxxVDY family protein [Litoribacter ruber]MBT0812606.1 IPExxxVDY family protein [Litoribacter ruber]
MKKTKLQVVHEYEFDLIGLVAPLKDYKMAWVINNSLDLDLARTKDYQLEFINQPALVISQYILEKDHGFIQLLRNRSYSKSDKALYLVPELKTIDYFLLLQDYTYELNINAYIEELSKHPYVQNVVKLDVTKLKSKENLLTY